MGSSISRSVASSASTHAAVGQRDNQTRPRSGRAERCPKEADREEEAGEEEGAIAGGCRGRIPNASERAKAREGKTILVFRHLSRHFRIRHQHDSLYPVALRMATQANIRNLP